MIAGRRQRRREEIDRCGDAPGHEKVIRIIRTGAEEDVSTATRLQRLDDHAAPAAIGAGNVENVLT